MYPGMHMIRLQNERKDMLLLLRFWLKNRRKCNPVCGRVVGININIYYKTVRFYISLGILVLKIKSIFRTDFHICRLYDWQMSFLCMD